jgi:hypothetical protein
MRSLLATHLALIVLSGSLVHCSQPQPAAPSVRAETRAQAPSQPSQPSQPAQPAQQQGGGQRVNPAPAEHAAHGEPQFAPPAQAQPATPGGTRRFGEPLAATARRVGLDEALRTHTQIGSTPIRVEGQIVAVCQHMGCWMEMRDGATQAHVRMHGHSFFLPRDVNGKRAAMVGTIVAAHAPTECDESAQAATGRRAAIEFDATGVEVID